MTDPSERPAAARFQRDQLTVSLYGTFVMWGWLLYSFNPSVPLLTADLGITRAQGGLHGTALAVGSVFAAMVTPRSIVARGRTATLAGGSAIVALGVVVLLLGPSLPWTLAGMLVLSFGANTAISTAQVTLALHHRRAASAAITEANGVGSAIGLVGPLAVGLSVGLGWGWRPAVAVTAVLAVATAIRIVRVRIPALTAVEGLVEDAAHTARTVASTSADDGASATSDSQRRTTGDAIGPTETQRARRRPRLAPHALASWCFLGAILAGIALENVTTYWSAELIVTQTGAPASIATAATAGLVAGMSIIRFIVGPMSLRVRPAHLLAASFLVAIVGWAVLWTATIPAVALTGLFVAGLGYGAQYPLAISLLLRAAGGAADKAQARATLAGGIAIGLAPFALGALADAVGPHRAFLLVPAIAVLGAIAALAGARSSRETGNE